MRNIPELIHLINAVEHEISEAHVNDDDAECARLCRERATLHESLKMLRDAM
jgi:hypothetical protein